MESDSSDNLSNSMIPINYSEDRCTPKELINHSGKRKRTTSKQLNKLILFMQTHPDFTKGTKKADEEKDLAWKILTNELNAMGPPVHSSKEWRTVWSQYKANKKRKECSKSLESNVETSSSSHEMTVEPGDETIDVGVLQGDLRNGKPLEMNDEMSLASTAKRRDVTPDIGVFKGDLKNGKPLELNDEMSLASFSVEPGDLEFVIGGSDYEDESLEKLQTVGVDAKRKRITSEQLSKLISFTETHAEFTKGTNKADCMQELDWECLVVELNVMGPPVHTIKEWRTVWSQYKANKKRKMATKQLNPNVVDQSALESCLHKITVKTDDLTPDVGFVKGDMKNDKNDCMDILSQKMVDLEKKISSSENRILKSIEDLKTWITEKFASVK